MEVRNMKRVKPVNPHSLCVQPTFIIGTYNEDGSANFAPITWVSITKDIDHYLLIISMKGLKKTKHFKHTSTFGKYSQYRYA